MSNLVIKEKDNEKKYEVEMVKDMDGDILVTVNGKTVGHIIERLNTIDLLVGSQLNPKEMYDNTYEISKKDL